MNIMESMHKLCLSNTALANEILPREIKALISQQCKTHLSQQRYTSNGKDDSAEGNYQHPSSRTRGTLTLVKAHNTHQ